MAISMAATADHALLLSPRSVSRCPSLPFKALFLTLHRSRNGSSRYVSTASQCPLLPTRRLISIQGLHSDAPRPIDEEIVAFKKSISYQIWDSWTTKFSWVANVPILFHLVSQIILNAQNLIMGNKSALLAIPWQGTLTNLVGNLLLVSYFSNKREREAIVIQTVGVISNYVLLAQLGIAIATPLPCLVITTTAVAIGLLLNLLNFSHSVKASIWRLWYVVITIVGLSTLSQVMWSTFVPHISGNILPGFIASVVFVMIILMSIMELLSPQGIGFAEGIATWTGTFLLMWSPIVQLRTNFLNPGNIQGLSVPSLLLSLFANILILPRALFIRNLMWFITTIWSTIAYSYGNILCLYLFGGIDKDLFLVATTTLISSLGLTLLGDAIAHEYNTPLRSLKELFTSS